MYSHFNGRLVHEDRGGVERGYVPDPLGSTVALVDEDGGITDEWTYWPYGEVSSHKGSSTTPFTFVGMLGYFKDLVSSLTYVRARFYQAFTAQWMTVDPMQSVIHTYSYASLSPLTQTDPSGLLPGYGRYCGPRNGPGEPIDHLDACCLQHDNCMAGLIDWIDPCKAWYCECTAVCCAVAARLKCLRERNWRCFWSSFVMGWYFAASCKLRGLAVISNPLLRIVCACRGLTPPVYCSFLS